MKNKLNTLLVLAFSYMLVGVLSGLFYREFTKANGFPDGGAPGQLGLVHTHLLTLGFFAMLIFLALEKLFRLSESGRLYAWFLWLYNLGVVLTGAMMVWHGILTIGGGTASGMISGIAGLGHILLTAGMIVLFFLLRAAIRRSSDARTPAQV